MVALLLIAGCGTSGTTVVNAALNTSLAVGASAVRRANGQCFTWCEQGTACNPRTGYCEVLPCRGACHEGEHCEGDLLHERCVSDVVKVQGTNAPAAPSPTQAAPVKPPWLP